MVKRRPGVLRFFPAHFTPLALLMSADFLFYAVGHLGNSPFCAAK